MNKRLGAILFVMLFTISVFGVAPHLTDKKQTTYCAKMKCAADSGLKAKCTAVKKADLQAKKVVKDDTKSIFSGFFSFKLPALPFENILLSAQKALAEKLF